METSSKLTINTLLEKLLGEKLISANDSTKITTFLENQKEDSATPWYIYAMVACAAWFAAIFFIIFLFAVGIVTDRTSSFAGLMFCIAAVFLHKNFDKQMFVEQLSLAANIAGQIMLIVGYLEGFGSNNWQSIFLAIILMEIVLSFLYTHIAQHFFTPGIIAGCMISYFFVYELFFMIHIVIIFLAALAIFLWYKESLLAKWNFYPPIKYGTTIALLCTVALSVIAFPGSTKIHWWTSGVYLAVVLLFLETIIFTKLNIKLTEPRTITILIATLVFCGISLNSPGLTASLLVVLLAFYRGNYIFVSISFACFSIFLFFYYYSLNISLLEKSLVLMGTGSVILGFRTYYMNKFAEVTS